MVVRSNQLDRNLAGTIEQYGFFAEFRQKNQYSTRGGHQFYRGENLAVGCHGRFIADIALR